MKGKQTQSIHTGFSASYMIDSPLLSLPGSVAMTMEAIQNIHYIIVCHPCLALSFATHSGGGSQSERASDSGFCFSLHPSPQSAFLPHPR